MDISGHACGARTDGEGGGGASRLHEEPAGGADGRVAVDAHAERDGAVRLLRVLEVVGEVLRHLPGVDRDHARVRLLHERVAADDGEDPLADGGANVELAVGAERGVRGGVLDGDLHVALGRGDGADCVLGWDEAARVKRRAAVFTGGRSGPPRSGQKADRQGEKRRRTLPDRPVALEGDLGDGLILPERPQQQRPQECSAHGRRRCWGGLVPLGRLCDEAGSHHAQH